MHQTVDSSAGLAVWPYAASTGVAYKGQWVDR